MTVIIDCAAISCETSSSFCFREVWKFEENNKQVSEEDNKGEIKTGLKKILKVEI